MPQILALSSDPEQAENFRTIDGRAYIKEDFLLGLFTGGKIGQTTHVEKLKAKEFKAPNINARPL